MNFRKALFLLFIMPLVALAQTQITPSKKELFCKTWKLEKYQEANGKSYPVVEEMKKDYLKYNCDGTFVSTEMGTLIKGKWFFDETTSTLTTTQTMNRNYPQAVKAKVIKITESELVVLAKDAEGKQLTLFMKSH